MRVLTLTCLLSCLVPVHADVRDSLIVAGITDDPEPVGIWAAAGPIGAATLNPNGDARGDGRPHVWRAPITDDPEPVGSTVVWAWNAGSDHDIAYAEWDGSAWGAVEFLTASTEDELDPRVFVDADGTTHVVWWVSPTEDVFLATRAPGGPWSDPVLVTQGVERGRRPSIAVVDGTIHVAYERESSAPGMAQDVVVAEPQPSGTFVRTLVASTPRSALLDAMIHVEGGVVWLDWIDDATALGRATRAAGSWSPAAQEPWLDGSWVGLEVARRASRIAIVSP